jgi:hypothetical protein
MSALAGLIDWKNPADVQRWKQEFYSRFERDRLDKKKPVSAVLVAPLLQGVAISADQVKARALLDEFALGGELVQWNEETVLQRLRRLDGRAQKPSKRTPEQAKHMVPRFIERDAAGWCMHPVLKRVSKGKLEKAQAMYDGRLITKANRELACGILGGEVHCENGHDFLAAYECGNRYCVTCGPRQANKLFARHRDRLFFVAQRLMLCPNPENCPDCNRAIDKKELPHWPPPIGSTPHVVCAKIDFTVRHEPGSPAPPPERMREMNDCIKKFFRALERKLGLKRNRYGVAFCDELGSNNNNPHAHGIYVGPWLPNTKKELALLWNKITREKFPNTFHVSIKYARNFAEALYHAVKYPAKFAERSSPQRLAELEIIFHGVRRFHTLAGFYNPEAPENPEPEARKCPKCGARLSDWYRWEGILEMKARGLRDLREVQREVNDARAQAPP